jgi:hypothetical protein
MVAPRLEMLFILVLIPGTVAGCRATGHANCGPCECRAHATRSTAKIPWELRFLPERQVSFMEQQIAEHDENCLVSIFLGSHGPDLRIRYVKGGRLICDRYQVQQANPVREQAYSVEVGSRAELFENVYRLCAAGYRCWDPTTAKLGGLDKCFMTTGSMPGVTLYDGDDRWMRYPLPWYSDAIDPAYPPLTVHHADTFVSFAEYVSVGVACLDAAAEIATRGNTEAAISGQETTPDGGDRAKPAEAATHPVRTVEDARAAYSAARSDIEKRDGGTVGAGCEGNP